MSRSQRGGAPGTAHGALRCVTSGMACCAGLLALLLFSCVSPAPAGDEEVVVTEEVFGPDEGSPPQVEGESAGEVFTSPLVNGFNPVATEFSEIWAYLIAGEEAELRPELPVTDVGYFGAEVDAYGELDSVPRRSKIDGFGGRVHLVVACNSRSLTHFVLFSESPARNRLIEQLVKAAGPFDGLQIDFELVPAKDGMYFTSFLRELRRRLPDKMLTAALPARTKVIKDDVYDYAKIAPHVDRILVMAYDEHWSTSKPGPIASMAWCSRIALHAKAQIPAKKLIMGIPFYGRIWGSENPFRAFFHSGIERIKRENNVTRIGRTDSVPYFTYTVPITVTGYYEDVVSLSRRLSLYRELDIDRVGFWRLGQEDPEVWNYIRTSAGTGPRQAP